MQRTDWKYLVDAVLFVSIFGIVAIGILLGLVIPRGPGAAEEAKYFLGLHRHQWGDLHFYLGLLFSVLLVVHLVLEWGWVKEKSRRLASARWPLLVGAVVVGGLAVPFCGWVIFRVAGSPYVEQRPVHARPGAPEVSRGPAGEHAGEIELSGQMTLRDIERRTGVPAGDIAAALGLPPTVSFDDSMGRLRKTYGFSMRDVRDAVTKALAAPKRP